MGDTSRQIPQSNNLMLAFFLLLVAALVHGDEIVCGEPEISPKLPGQKILNGEEATPHSFPWQVSITGALNYDADHYCGASILSPSWVLTAAHCAEIVYIGTYTGDVVWLGMHDRRGGEDDADRQMIKISEKFIHPEYDSPARANDVALLKLETAAVMSKTVSPACLPDQGDFGDSSSFPEGANCILSGWGKQAPGEGIPADDFGQPWKLRRGELPLISDAECAQIYLEGAGFTIQPTMQCAGGKGKSACNGDSGGPLVCQGEDNKWYQAGIVSFGPSPCDTQIPSVFTRVAGFRDWIEKTVEQNGGWE